MSITDIEKVEKVPLVAQRGGERFMQTAGGELRPGDIEVPRIQLVQALSKVATEGPNKAGEIINSLTGEIYAQPLEFVPIFRGYSRRLEKPRKSEDIVRLQDESGKDMDKEWHTRFFQAVGPIQGGDTICQSLDMVRGTSLGDCASCGCSKPGPNRLPACAVALNFVVAEPAKLHAMRALTFKKTSFRAAKRLNAMHEDLYGSAQPLYNRVYKLAATREEKDGAVYYKLKVDLGRETTAEERALCADHLAKAQAGRVVAHESEASSEE